MNHKISNTLWILLLTQERKSVSSKIPVVRLKAGREKSLLRKHPWVFSGAVAELIGSPENGASVRVTSASGEFLGWAAYSKYSQISARIWSWDERQVVGEAFFRKQLATAILTRERLGLKNSSNAIRLVHGESDGLPGLVVDRYGEFLVFQSLSSGVEYWKETLAELLLELTGAAGIYERSDVDVRRLEGLEEHSGILRGRAPEGPVKINENQLQFWVDIQVGHKTGFYLDQRNNRARVRALAAGCEVLDCFCYSGGFSINALAGGAASVLAVDASAEVLQTAKENLLLNEMSGAKYSQIQGDVFQVLRSLRDQRCEFDMLILDPPKFAPTASQAQQAARGYKDINLLAFKLLKPGGLLVTFSCSGGVDALLFQKIVAGAALDAGIEAAIIEQLHQSPDHPIGLNFPEGAYLKGLICHVMRG
jgi:23S rRNA (cytosine1962-C5)-methyltransferase